MSGPVHLFYVHSHITYLMVRAIIRDHELAPDDCVFFVHDQYELPEPETRIRCEVFKNDYFSYSKFYGRNVDEVRKNVAEIDDLVDRATGGRPFVFYPTGTLLPVFRLVISHEKCVSFSVVEEGVYPFKPATRKFPVYDKALMRRCNDDRILFPDNEAFCVAHPKYDRFFVSYENNYPFVEKNKTVLRDVFRKIDASPWNDADAILVMDNVTSSYRLAWEPYERTLKWLVEEHFEPLSFKKVFVRYRYRFNYAYAEKEKAFFRSCRGIEFPEIEEGVIMENLLYSCEIPVYFNISSLGIYAAVQGRDTRSFNAVYEAFDGSYRRKNTEFGFRENALIPSGVRILPPVDRDGTPLPQAREHFLNYVVRTGTGYLREHAPYSLLALAQNLERVFHQWRSR